MTPRVALVSGGGRGIGRAIVLRLAKDGLGVAVAARTVEQVEETAALVRTTGARALALALDVTDPTSVSAAVQHTTRELGAIDVLVNNA